MLASPRFIKRCAEWIPKEESKLIPPATRGIYALLDRQPRTNKYDVVYVGMTARRSVGRRLARHKNSKKIWNYFSIFEVRDNIGEDEILELEGFSGKSTERTAALIASIGLANTGNSKR
jgi:hypothetical protein